MAWFRFVSEALLRLVKETSVKKDVQDGIVGVVKDGFGHVHDLLNKGKVEEAKTYSAEAHKGAEAIAGAIMKNTGHEGLVDPTFIHGTPEANAAAE